MITIEKSKIEDVDKILEIIDHARGIMRRNGNMNQWVTTPNREMILNDINDKCSYVIKENGEICATFMFKIGLDDTYIKIDGNWLNDNEYGVIHRIASNEKIKGVLSLAKDYALNHIKDIKMDTHEDNTIMQHLLLKNGFKYCGIIITTDGTPRLAYHLSK